MPATMTLTREAYGIELRRGSFHVVLDGRDRGVIERHDTLQMPVDPGRHVLRITAGRYSSRPRPFEAADGGTVTFRCHGAMMWPRYVASIVKPDLAISLTRQ